MTQDRAQKRERLRRAAEELIGAIYALGICDVPSETRSAAADNVSRIHRSVIAGMDRCEDERQAKEEADVIKAFREGRVTIQEPVKA